MVNVYDVTLQPALSNQNPQTGYGAGLYGTNTYGNPLGGMKSSVQPPKIVDVEPDLIVYSVASKNSLTFDSITCGVQ